MTTTDEFQDEYGAARDTSSRVAASIGRTIRRMRREHGYTLQEVSSGAKVSASFVGALERGETDIAIGRLERIADFFEEDLQSILGYSREDVRFNYVPAGDWQSRDVGAGIEYAECVVPGASQRLVRLTLDAQTRYAGPDAEGGMISVFVIAGEVQVVVADRLFHLHPGDTGAFAAGNAHAFANKTDSAASLLVSTAVGGRSTP